MRFKRVDDVAYQLYSDKCLPEVAFTCLDRIFQEQLTTTSILVTFTDRHLHTRPRTLAETRSSFIRKGAAKAATNHRTCTKKTETTSTTLSQSGQEAALDQAPETRRPSTRRHRAEQPWLTNPTNRLLARAAVTENPQRIYPVRNRWQLQTSPREKRNTAPPPPRGTNTAFSLVRPLTRTEKENRGGRREKYSTPISRSDARSEPLPPLFSKRQPSSHSTTTILRRSEVKMPDLSAEAQDSELQERNRGRRGRGEARRKRDNGKEGRPTAEEKEAAGHPKQGD
ncbi:hypothetical protein YC2023_079655 [Brassica napus]